ncbi:hypothetical protein Y032_0466g1959 [Ancylostoma ceylanicum]|uniref:Uncharacterized protein n=1 Tax=Ancylostoma ceylanicum TaxID=53326 RepID=A0A016WZ09_9BILA|nr:hypothetical protein Y032_0466g1959 [Ancylostoma ceylanicum]
MTTRRASKRPATKETNSHTKAVKKATVAKENERSEQGNAGVFCDATNRSCVGGSGDVPASLHVPQFLIDFFAHAKCLCRDDPCASFGKLASCRLVGLFDALSGRLCEMDERELYKPSASCSHYDSDNQLRLHYRYATDLPEMQTVIVCNIGRYCLWRDVPNSEEGWIVYVPNDDRFPKIELIGNCMEHAIVHLAGKSDMDPREFLPEPADVAAVKQQMKSACALRNKKKLGKAPNGAGIWVEVVNDVGYRPISEDAAKIRKTLDLICDTDDNSLRQKKMQWLMEIVTFAQIANDECDFGMGLELGHWLFLANHQLLDKVAYRVLSTAYTLLGRVEYKKVLDAQMAPGIRRRSEVDMRKENTVS